MLGDVTKKRLIYPRLSIAAMIVLLSACLEPYSPKVSDDEFDVLVVDGFLDSSDGSGKVRLTKATNLANGEPVPVVSFASVMIEGDDGSSFDLAESTTPGEYVVESVTVNASVKYRLHVEANASEYTSDYVEIKPTPAIDSLSHAFDSEGTTIFTNTHDASGNTRYYRWEYVETYEYTARLYSQFKIVNKVPVYRTDDELIYRCYRTINSTKILATSTVQLQEDYVQNFPVIKIAPGDKRLYIRYSVEVKQRAISKQEFTFLDQLRKTTEGIGTLFDPQPSQVLGNLHNLSGGTTPLGYFSAGNSTSKRIFIKYTDLPDYLQEQEFAYCPVDTICVVPHAFQCSKNIEDLTGNELLIDQFSSMREVLGYSNGAIGCADCRYAGGVVKKPEFWP